HTVRLRNSKKGDRYATFLLEDKEGVVEVIAWPDTYRRHEEVVTGGTPVVVSGGLAPAADACQGIADEIARLDAARAEAVKQVHVKVPLAHVGREDLERLRTVLAEHPGPCSAFLHLMRADATETILALPDTIRVAASSAVLDAVERVLGAGMLSFRLRTPRAPPPARPRGPPSWGPICHRPASRSRSRWSSSIAWPTPLAW